jgi:hypothetical protein
VWTDPIEPMTLGDMRSNGVRLIHHEAAECRLLARPHGGADVRAANGVHPLRNHRCRRPAELTGAAGARDADGGAMAMNGTSQRLTVEQRRVLQMLAGSANGCVVMGLIIDGSGLPPSSSAYMEWMQPGSTQTSSSVPRRSIGSAGSPSPRTLLPNITPMRPSRFSLTVAKY